MPLPGWQVTAEEMNAVRDRMAKRCEEVGIVPIPAICTGRHRHEWLDTNGNGAIRAPSLRNCRCFWCGASLEPHPSTLPRQAELELA